MTGSRWEARPEPVGFNVDVCYSQGNRRIPKQVEQDMQFSARDL
ncbi:MAG TPA: hypothetical protein VFA13_10640 [Candidatus Acidoferrum sp.]|nr:hypothetical protein [Candidatus Acidoferrum sp.]